ncbi:apoptosis-inducing factor 3 isoform X2 [Cimex lectularius]|uniref:Rieske domain-containing protein n=1 Tax=Cimex lectularius TaxID=79782 RepID=A0A8I6RU73_CIMLE|nr:apoptosis-inducing factor 3 isoform X2 [Cimex lectularius]
MGSSPDRHNHNGGNNYIEGVVCQAEDIPENGMKVCDLGDDGKVLVVKKNGRFSALGTKCTHYGAPLVKGALGDNRIRCPWHGACFNIQTGDIEDFPGLDSIPCYNVQVTPEGGVKVRAKLSELSANKRQKSMMTIDCKNNNIFVIIGGGPAGLVCAETLRQEGFSGKLVMVTSDKYLPYDRIKLSKQLDMTIDKIQLRPENFYETNNIEVKTDTEVTKVCTDSKKLTLCNGEEINYTSLFIATGGIPRRISIPGINLKNIFTLRTLNDANEIQKHLNPEANVVIYGSSFIGMEAAAYCLGKVKSVTVVGRSSVPFAESLGNAMGERVAKLFKEKGVQMKMIITITSFLGEEKVEKVVLSDGTELPADVVILGLGASPATNFLKGSKVRLNSNGTVPVNKFLETNCPNIFAGGDIAEAPVYALKDESLSIGHWGLAHYHGRIAALNMMSNATPLKTIPFFWTMLFGTSFRVAGSTYKHDAAIVKGDVEGLKFVVYYCKGDNVIGVTTVGTDPLAAEFAELLHNGKSLSKAQIEANPLDWFTQK